MATRPSHAPSIRKTVAAGGCLFLLLFVAISPTLAQNEAVLRLEEQPEGTSSFVFMVHSDHRSHGRFEQSLAYHDDFYWSSANDETTLSTLIGAPLSDNALITVEVPILWMHQAGVGYFEFYGGPEDAHSVGVGDIVLATRVTERQLMGSAATRMHLVLGMVVPTGQTGVYPAITDLSRDWFAAMDVEQHTPGGFLANVAMEYRVNGYAGSGVKLGDAFRTTIGFGYSTTGGRATMRHRLHGENRELSIAADRRPIQHSDDVRIWTSHELDFRVTNTFTLRPAVQFGLDNLPFNRPPVRQPATTPLAFSLDMVVWLPTGKA